MLLVGCGGGGDGATASPTRTPKKSPGGGGKVKGDKGVMMETRGKLQQMGGDYIAILDESGKRELIVMSTKVKLTNRKSAYKEGVDVIIGRDKTGMALVVTVDKGLKSSPSPSPKKTPKEE